MTYEYLCTSCGHAWEAEQSISAAPLTTCPTCHQETAKRQVSGGAGFILKGGGWYADLYSSSSKSSSGGDSSTKSEPAKATTDTKSSDKGSSGSSSSGSGSTGTPAPSTPSGSKATSAASGA